MKLTTQRRIAASLLKCGKNRVRYDPERLNEIKEAITKADLRGLISTGAIFKNISHGISSFRKKQILKQKRKGRRKGQGSRKGKKTARLSRKKLWQNKIRAQRKLLRKLKEKKLITPQIFRELYYKAKGGYFRNVRHIKLYLEEHKLIQNEKKVQKTRTSTKKSKTGQD